LNRKGRKDLMGSGSFQIGFDVGLGSSIWTVISKSSLPGICLWHFSRIVKMLKNASPKKPWMAGSSSSSLCAISARPANAYVSSADIAEPKDQAARENRPALRRKPSR
jgi:hypothetical protein